MPISRFRDSLEKVALRKLHSLSLSCVPFVSTEPTHPATYLACSGLVPAGRLPKSVSTKTISLQNIQLPISYSDLVIQLSLSYPTPYPRCYLCRWTMTGSRISYMTSNWISDSLSWSICKDSISDRESDS